ncbi:MAG: hypothetical protein MJ210_01135 [Alphaproteobacteria bacterium]|nr:hypothetical protein [Alphaproteobacteria bacterium]
MKRFDRLLKRNSTYYIRAKLPEELKYLCPTKMFSYSLRTNDYYTALEKYRKESYKIDLKIMLLRKFDMLLKNKELILDDADINRVIIHRLKELDKLFTIYYDDIVEHNYQGSDFSLFSNTEKIKSNSKDLKTLENPEKLSKTAKSGERIQVSESNKSNYELNCIEVYLKG